MLFGVVIVQFLVFVVFVAGVVVFVLVVVVFGDHCYCCFCRPGSIQTSGQLQCVREFAEFVKPHRSIFITPPPITATATTKKE